MSGSLIAGLGLAGFESGDPNELASGLGEGGIAFKLGVLSESDELNDEFGEEYEFDVEYELGEEYEFGVE